MFVLLVFFLPQIYFCTIPQKLKETKRNKKLKTNKSKVIRFFFCLESLLNSPPGGAAELFIEAVELGTKLTKNGREYELFPCVCSLRNGRAGGDHVQQVLPLTGVHSGGRLVTGQTGVHVGHGHSYGNAPEEWFRVRCKLSPIKWHCFSLY